jgi:rubrerythrin
MGDTGREERTERREKEHETDGSPEAEGTQDRDTGFLFCPRCGQVVLGVGVNSLCPQCGHRFCPSCSD